MARYLITGGAGFIGSNVATRLVHDGESVTVFDNFATGNRKNLSHLADDLAVIEGDIRDLGALKTAVTGMDYVIHLAALPSVPRSVKDPVSSHEVCATGTLNALVAARDAGVKRFVYASSSAIYGESEELPKVEHFLPAPLSPYGTAKMAGESYCCVFHRVYQLPTVSLRYFNVYGPRQDPTSAYAAAIASFVSRLLAGQSPRIFGDGEQTRDFTFIEDVVTANLLACRTEGLGGDVFNIAGGSRVSLNQLVSLLIDIISPGAVAEHLDPRSGDIKDSEADISLALEKMGFVPQTSLADGLKRTTDWYRTQT